MALPEEDKSLADLDRVIGAFLERRLGDDAWILQDLIVFLQTEHAVDWSRWRARLGEMEAEGWLAALTRHLLDVESRQHFRL